MMNITNYNELNAFWEELKTPQAFYPLNENRLLLKAICRHFNLNEDELVEQEVDRMKGEQDFPEEVKEGHIYNGCWVYSKGDWYVIMENTNG